MGGSRNGVSGHSRVRLRAFPSTFRKLLVKADRRAIGIAHLGSKRDAWSARQGGATARQRLCVITALSITFQSPPCPMFESHKNSLATRSVRVPAEIRRLPQPHRAGVEDVEVPGHQGALLSNLGASRRDDNTCCRLLERPPLSVRLGEAAAPSGPKAQYRSHADGPGYDRMKMHRTYRTSRMLSSPRILPVR